jgi:hypothetical protein
MATTEGDTTLWKHIGLHGHSVGSFACEPGGIKWKSALFGRDDNVTSGAARSIPKDAITNAQWTVFGRSAHLRIQTTPTSKLQHELRFDGFPPTDFDTLKDVFKDKFGLELTKYNMSAAGTQFGLSRMSGKKLTFRHCILEDADEEGEEFEPREGEEMLSLDLGGVSQCVLPGNNRNEIELQFPESDAVEANNDQLVSIRFYIPPDPEADPADRTFKSSAELLQQRIMSTANIRKTTGDVIVEFEHDKGSFLTPRGRYSIELCKYSIEWEHLLIHTVPGPHSQNHCIPLSFPQTIDSFECAVKNTITRSSTTTFQDSFSSPSPTTYTWPLSLPSTNPFDRVNSVTNTWSFRLARIRMK